MNPRRGRLRLAYSAGRGRAARTLRCTNDFGLTPRELRRELHRLADLGWQTWELAHRFGCTPCEDTINTDAFGGAA
jgi:hypothetical protein